MSSEEKSKAVRAEVLQAALLDEVAERLLALQKLAQAEVPEGVVEPIEKFHITSIPTHLPRLEPWFSMSLINDGPDSVLVIVNTAKSFDEHEVLAGETYNINMLRALIKDVRLWCRAGETATVRLVGVR